MSAAAIATVAAGEYTRPDFTFVNHGSVFIVTPQNKHATAWLEEHVINAETQHWGKGIVVEPRYVDNLGAGMEDAGFIIEGE